MTRTKTISVRVPKGTIVEYLGPEMIPYMGFLLHQQGILSSATH